MNKMYFSSLNFVVVRVILPELFLKPVLQFQFCQHQEFAKIKPETIYSFLWKLLTISKKKNQDEKREATPALNYHGDFKSKSRLSQQIFPGDSAVFKD